MENTEELTNLIEKFTELMKKQIGVDNKINEFTRELDLLKRLKKNIETEIKTVSAKIETFNNN